MFLTIISRIAAVQLQSRTNVAVFALFSNDSNRKSDRKSNNSADVLPISKTTGHDASYFTRLLYEANPELLSKEKAGNSKNAHLDSETPTTTETTRKNVNQGIHNKKRERLKWEKHESVTPIQTNPQNTQFRPTSQHQKRLPDFEFPTGNNNEISQPSNTTVTTHPSFDIKQYKRNLQKETNNRPITYSTKPTKSKQLEIVNYERKGESITSQLLEKEKCGANSLNVDGKNDLLFESERENLVDYVFTGSEREEEVDGSVVDLAKLDPLAPCNENLDLIAPVLPLSFNLASYANKSHTMQQLLKLGVDLSTWDAMKGVPDFILKLDFDKDMTGHIRFLHDLGISAEDLGRFLTKNPRVFQEDLEILGVRIEYLTSKNFTVDNITRILTAQPRVLQLNVAELDRRLGNIQKLFQLSGDELRHVVVRNPRIVIHDFESIKNVQFSVREEMGFNEQEIKTLILTKPKLWLIRQEDLVHRFNFIHNKMEIAHKLIVHFPSALLARNFIVRQRHLFLKLIGKSQYDPLKEGYVSLKALVTGTDTDFCRDVAKMPVSQFNKFLKTL